MSDEVRVPREVTTTEPQSPSRLPGSIRLAVLLGPLLLACGGGAAAPDGGGTGDGPPPVVWSAPMGMCEIQTATMPLLAGQHVPECSALPPGTNPRTSGAHYPVWPVFRVYDKAVPWGYLLHGLEHGAVVIAYNCPQSCLLALDLAKKVIDGATPKAGCIPPTPPVILTPDPTIEPGFEFVAAAWGQGLRAKCFDSAAFAEFIAANANHGPEFFPSDCGTVDKEATGWCP
jgi:hypothetical protein